jgi:hypothetical protein
VVVTTDWAAITAISVAVIALVQVAAAIGLLLAMRRMQVRVANVERRLEAAVDEVQPQLARLVEEARAASSGAQALVSDIRRHLESMEEAAHSVRQGVHRVVDGVQVASHALPVPIKVSAPVALATWAAVRVARSALGRIRNRRRRRLARDVQISAADSYLGVG